MSTKHLSTTEEFISWAEAALTRPSTKKYTFRLWHNYDYQHDENGELKRDADGQAIRTEQTRYELKEAGASYHGDYVYLPEEVGKVVAAQWKKSGPHAWSSYVGMRDAAGVLKLFNANAVGDVKARAAAARAESERKQKVLRRNNARKAVAAAAKAVGDQLLKTVTAGDLPIELLAPKAGETPAEYLERLVALGTELEQ